ncbi:MAG: T9SS type A sorting domain-containing protein [Flavobacteriales bacterium]|nr:T9SS type A sorting domain-containing protein [Flavobacteriales bacterium]
MYPNPTAGLLTISSAATTIERVRILGANGQEVYRMDNVGRSAMTIDLSNVSDGMYMILVNDRTHMKLIKN